MTVARGVLLSPLATIVLRRCGVCFLSLLMGLPGESGSGRRSGGGLGPLLRRIAAVGAGKQLDQEDQAGNQERGYPRDPQ
jgi:hypothetical protein